jgi:branched-chain amino acid transport system permease protein
MLAIELALAGLAVGSIAALAGIGLLATYRATGVFNLAFGAIAVLVAYLLWQVVRVWHWPIALAAPLDLLVVAPGLGVLLDRVVFRPLQRRRVSPAESLVASIGVLVLIIGIVTLVWGTESKSDAPSLLPSGSIALPGGATIGTDTVTVLALVAAVGLLMGLIADFTRFGASVKAVVDRRELAEQVGIDADRISAVGWAFGTFLAGLAGVLLAPRLRLNPYGLTFVVLETMAVVVAARLVSLPVAGVVAIAIGVAQSELTQVHVSGQLEFVVQSAQSNLFVIALLVALLLLRRMAEVGAGASVDTGSAPSLATRRTGESRPGWGVAVLLLVMPFSLSGQDLQALQLVPALAVIFLSIVAVTGYSGQISLGQAGYAGLGALLAARLSGGGFFGLPTIPALLALVIGALLVTPVGLLTGWPAIRRRGLFLALTTFAVGAVVSRFVFQQPVFTTNLSVHRPSAFASDRAFYFLELACLALTIFLVRNLHVHRLGRALLAVRDGEAGARACGVDVGRLKVFIFAVSSGLAGLGGVLISMSSRSFDASTFDPIQGLFWFAAVIVFGADSATGAILAAGLIVLLNQVVAQGAAIAAVGVLAVVLGRMPGGLVALVRRWLQAAAPLLAPEPEQVRRLGLTRAGRAAQARLHR